LVNGKTAWHTDRPAEDGRSEGPAISEIKRTATPYSFYRTSGPPRG